MDELIKKLRMYADTYKEEPTGREVKGIVELLENSADALQEAKESCEVSHDEVACFHTCFSGVWTR